MKSKLITTIGFIFFIFLNLSIDLKAKEECFEGLSRSIFKFNMAFDEGILEPIAKGYNKLPKPLKSGTNNFTSNISTLLSIPNNLLQGNFYQLAQSMGSFIVNSSVGIFGIFNPAEKIGLNPTKEDVGQTLGKYGIDSGCYFVLPVLGPTTLRDSIGMIADSYIDPFAHVTIREKKLFDISGNSTDFYSVKGATAVDFRSINIANFESMEKNSLDLYSSMKSIYLQDRENKIKNSKGSSEDWEKIEN